MRYDSDFELSFSFNTILCLNIFPARAMNQDHLTYEYNLLNNLTDYRLRI